MSLWDDIKTKYWPSTAEINNKPIDYETNALVAEEAIVLNPYEFGSRNIIEYHKTRLWGMFPSKYEYNWFTQNYIFPEIYFSVDFISKQIAQLKVDVFKNVETGERAKYSNIRYLLNYRANDSQSAYDFKYQLISELFYNGHVYCYYNKDEIFVVSEKQIFDIPGYDNYWCLGDIETIKFIKDNYDASEINLDSLDVIIIDKNDLIHLKSNHFGCGLSPISFLWKDLGIIRDLNSRYKDNIDNGGKRQAIVFSKGKAIGEKGSKTINSALNEMIQSGKSGALTLDAMEMKIDTWEVPMIKSSELLTPKKELKQMIQEYLGIPSGLIGGDSHQGVDEKIRLFYTVTVSSLLEQLEEELTNKLFKKKFAINGGKVVINTDRLFFGDITTRINNQINLKNAKIIDVNEARINLGYEKNEKLNRMEVQDEQTKENGVQDNSERD